MIARGDHAGGENAGGDRGGSAIGSHGVYPGRDIERTSRAEETFAGARVERVEAGSPADDAGFEPGCIVRSVDGEPVRDVIDWRWLASEDCIEVGYIDLDGDAGEVELWREPGEDWGFEFDGVVFDEVRQCRNACTFCFMRQLPKGLRSSLYLRDDDFRLSFLSGTFVTLTNVTADDEARIVEQRISPLRVSLQAIDDDVRARLMGKHAKAGVEVLDRLLAAGIEFHAQIVLVPGENDGEALARTLAWAYDRPGILAVGIVPLGYTRYQDVFDQSFNDPPAARAVLELVEPFQQRALAERGNPWVFAADEFYCNALGAAVVDLIPRADFYGDFSMFEDGIGIVRSYLDNWEEAHESGLSLSCAELLEAQGMQAFLVAGYAQRAFLDKILRRYGLGRLISPLYVDNRFFGGNVTVTGLLAGCDIAQAVRRLAQGANAGALPVGWKGDRPKPLFCVPSIVFNDDGLTLDGMLLEDMERAAGQPLHVVSLNPTDYLREISALAVASSEPSAAAISATRS